MHLDTEAVDQEKQIMFLLKLFNLPFLPEQPSIMQLNLTHVLSDKT